MARVSNGFVGLINILTLLLSLSSLAASFYLYLNRASSACQKTLQEPLLVLGRSLFVISLLGLLGACCKVNSLLYPYLFFMFLLILALICSTVFTILVANKGVGKAVSGRGFKEYRLGDYSNWLQTYAVNDHNWPGIKSCLVDTKVCSSESLGVKNPQESAADFYKRSLSPTQVVASHPRTADSITRTQPCGQSQKQALQSPYGLHDMEQQSVGPMLRLQVVQAGILANIKKEWRILAIINTCILVFVIFVYSVGCCALRNNKSSKYSKYRGGYA